MYSPKSTRKLQGARKKATLKKVTKIGNKKFPRQNVGKKVGD